MTGGGGREGVGKGSEEASDKEGGVREIDTGKVQRVVRLLVFFCSDDAI